MGSSFGRDKGWLPKLYRSLFVNIYVELNYMFGADLPKLSLVVWPLELQVCKEMYFLDTIRKEHICGKRVVHQKRRGPQRR